MAPALSAGLLVGVSTAPAGNPQPLMAPHKAAVLLFLFSRAHYKWVVLPAVANSGERHQVSGPGLIPAAGLPSSIFVRLLILGVACPSTPPLT